MVQRHSATWVVWPVYLAGACYLQRLAPHTSHSSLLSCYTEPRVSDSCATLQKPEVGGVEGGVVMLLSVDLGSVCK